GGPLLEERLALRAVHVALEHDRPPRDPTQRPFGDRHVVLRQIDEPSAAIVPGQIGEYVKMFNACVEGVRARIAYHICFGNLLSRPRGKRSYRWMFPALLDAKCQQFVFEYANREMAEIEHWKEIGVDRDVACGVVDVKSFYLETAEEVAERLALCAKS